MESQCPPHLRQARAEGNSGNVECKCGEGWTCIITKTSGPDAGKSLTCGENYALTIEGEKVREEEIKEGGEGAYCKCGEGWSCVVSKGCDCSAPCTTTTTPPAVHAK